MNDVVGKPDAGGTDCIVRHMDASRKAREGLFDQELNEVALLIDFISGRSDRSLSALAIPDPDDRTKTLTFAEVVERVSSMRYPPPPATEVANARNSAILLLAKDQLSYLASPVRGLTIAYTAMFVDAEAKFVAPYRLLQDLFRRIRGLRPDVPPGPDSRIDLAARTFPAYRDHAVRFAIWRTCLGYFTLLWFALTLFAYWDAGLGRSALDRLDQSWKYQIAEVARNPLLMHCPDAAQDNPPADSQNWVKQLTGNDSPTALELGKAMLDCRQFNYARLLSSGAGREVKRVFQCDGSILLHLHHIWCWPWVLPNTFESPGAPAQTSGGGADVSPYVKDNATYWQDATLIQTLFTAFILPMMFGLLGALIGSFRAIARAVADNELAPRDFFRMQLGIPIGLVAGVAVALFLNPSTVPILGAGNVSGELTLTASGLGFLAGYAAERFFRFIDSISNVVLPDHATPAAPASPATRPQPSPSPAGQQQ